MHAAQQNQRPINDADREAVKASLAAILEFQAGLTPETDLRAAVDGFVSSAPMAEGVALESVNQAGMRGWWVRPEKMLATRVILYLHGGGYTVGSAMAYRAFASQLAKRAGLATFVLDYPLAPEAPFPAAYDAVIAALRWLAAQGLDRVAVVGDSAGGGLALAAIGEPATIPARIGAVIAFSPWTDLALTGESLSITTTEDPMITAEATAYFAAQYLAGADPKDGRASPLYRIPDVPPPIYIQVGANEHLLDDSRRYAALARERGGMVRLDVWEGLAHVFQMNFATLQNARLALDDAAHFLEFCWEDDSD
jgi:monoterpene epsilon-lactone hydrolase